nr:hypothetical protein [Saprospiraceae bacterium]
MRDIIIVTELKDLSADYISQWILGHGIKFGRINTDDKLFRILSITSSKVVYKDTFGINEINCNSIVWFRRPINYDVLTFSIYQNENNKEFNDRVFKFSERRDVITSLFKWV